MLDDIKVSRMRCFDSGHSEPRDFGVSDYKDGAGHSVLYCDDCILPNVYEYYRNILLSLLEHRRTQIVDENDLHFMDPEDGVDEEKYDFEIQDKYNWP
eukprot:288096_1